ncbi:MAG: bifunctional phosphoribosyl-AMP cyclohydrolase/phosphoribosyl-ATP diphosphatase HisIE [Nitrospirae bacterium]|nr:bifunctional phosphoribosyl-AMP cyclohydrolase/phosphoribosyl-ATP diphosphatase HisIE [Candidatus Manganitrophaceae bacterium]
MIKIDLSNLPFKEGLIPAVVQDIDSKAVLMLAYMNEDSLRLSLETGETHFWSRSRNCLWHKGETSGHIQKIKNIFVDCDEDTLLVEVIQTGVACHTGAANCFYRRLSPSGELEPFASDVELRDERRPILETLSETIMARKKTPDNKSYTSFLMQGGIDRILKKVAEESGELLIAAKNGERKEIIHESADLLYHLLVSLGYFDIPFSAIETELKRRTACSGLAEKAARTENT